MTRYRLVWLTVVSLSCFAPCRVVADTSAADEKLEAKTEEKAVPPTESLTLGIDYYYGGSTLPGFRRFNDGFWAGSTLGAPSEARAHWEDGKGAAGHLSLGLGDYRTQAITRHQPLEAWYKAPVGKLGVTAGKFWVPFALYEWQGETKWGLMVEGEQGASALAASINYNDITHNGNLYSRFSRRFGKNATLGLSVGAGKGLSFGSLHNKALGLDATITWRGWQILSEHVVLQRRAADRLRFGYARLSYEKLGRVKPYLAYYRWRDRSGEFGDFRSTVLGVNLQLTPEFALEGATAATSTEGNVSWLQMHWMWERPFND